MHLDVTDLSAFYDSGLGTVVRRILRRRIRSLWPDVRGLRILGLGYATPYLGPFTDEAERVIALMPGAQGVKAWPRKKRNLTALCEDHDLALADCSMARPSASSLAAVPSARGFQAARASSFLKPGPVSMISSAWVRSGWAR